MPGIRGQRPLPGIRPQPVERPGGVGIGCRILAKSALFEPPASQLSDGRRELAGLSKPELRLRRAQLGGQAIVGGSPPSNRSKPLCRGTRTALVRTGRHGIAGNSSLGVRAYRDQHILAKNAVGQLCHAQPAAVALGVHHLSHPVIRCAISSCLDIGMPP